MKRRRVGYHRVTATKIKSSLEDTDVNASFIEVCERIVQEDLAWRFHTFSTANEDVTCFLYDFEKTGDFYKGRFVRLRHEDLVTFTSNDESFASLDLGEGSSLSEIMHFVYSPSLRVLAVDTGRSVPGVIQLFRYLNVMQFKDGYIYDAVKLGFNVIGHPDIIRELRKHDSVKTLTVIYDDGNAIDTEDPLDVRRSIGSFGGVGKVTRMLYGVKRGNRREDVISTDDLISKLEADEFQVGAFGNVSAQVATEYGEITLRLFGDKIKEYIDMPRSYYAKPEEIYTRIITSINDNQGILSDVRNED